MRFILTIMETVTITHLIRIILFCCDFTVCLILEKSPHCPGSACKHACNPPSQQLHRHSCMQAAIYPCILLSVWLSVHLSTFASLTVFLSK